MAKARQHDQQHFLSSKFKRSSGGVYVPAAAGATVTSLALEDSVDTLITFDADSIADDSGNANLTGESFTTESYSDAQSGLGRALLGNGGRIEANYSTAATATVMIAFNHGALADQKILAAEGPGSPSANRPWQITVQNDGTLQTAYSVASSPSTQTFGTGLEDSQWHMVVARKNWTTGVESAWLDGTLTVDAQAGSTTRVQGTPPRYAVFANTDDDKNYNGKIALFAYFESELSAARIAEYFTAAGF